MRNALVARKHALPSGSVFLLLAIAAALAIESAGAQQPFFMGLGDLPGGAFLSYATDVSANGTVVTGYTQVGGTTLFDSTYEAFRWTRSTGMVGLGLYNGLGTGSSRTFISGDGSTIIGQFAGSPGRSYRWRDSTGIVPLAISNNNLANAINADGSIILGQYQPTSGDNQAVRWTESGGVEELFTHLDSTVPYGISADGAVILAGEALLGPFVSSPANGITFLGAEVVVRSGGLSADGKVVIGDVIGEAFRWTAETGVQGLGALPDGGVPRVGSGAGGVSADGSVIVGRGGSTGTSITVPGTSLGLVSRPVIWDSTHGSRYLFDVLKSDYGLAGALAGWQEVGNATYVSEDGRAIVGVGINPDGNGEAWIAYLGPSVITEPGDFNGDGLVDGADLVAWQRGESPDPLSAADLAAWKQNFGPPGTVDGAATVPEPAGAALALAALAILARGGVVRRRRSREMTITCRQYAGVFAGSSR